MHLQVVEFIGSGGEDRTPDLGIMSAVGGASARFCTIMPERDETLMNTGDPRSRSLCAIVRGWAQMNGPN
jgi:hypothetical protein